MNVSDNSPIGQIQFSWYVKQRTVRGFFMDKRGHQSLLPFTQK